MNYKNNSYLIELAIQCGCKTAKEFADFLRKYASKVEKTPKKKEISQPSLF